MVKMHDLHNESNTTVSLALLFYNVYLLNEIFNKLKTFVIEHIEDYTSG